MAAILHPLPGLNAARSSSWPTGCGPASGPSSLKHNTYRVPPCSVTEARLATYPGRVATVKRVEQPAVQHRLKHAPQTLQLERVSRSEINLNPTLGGLRPGDRQGRLSHVDAQDRQSQRGNVQRVLAGPAARI